MTLVHPAPSVPPQKVNGPVRDEAGLNYKHGAMGSGSRANATIGRALKLVLQNVVRKGGWGRGRGAPTPTLHQHSAPP